VLTLALASAARLAAGGADRVLAGTFTSGFAADFVDALDRDLTGTSVSSSAAGFAAEALERDPTAAFTSRLEEIAPPPLTSPEVRPEMPVSMLGAAARLLLEVPACARTADVASASRQAQAKVVIFRSRIDARSSSRPRLRRK